jgi:hypothetical protein
MKDEEVYFPALRVCVRAAFLAEAERNCKKPGFYPLKKEEVYFPALRACVRAAFLAEAERNCKKPGFCPLIGVSNF